MISLRGSPSPDGRRMSRRSCLRAVAVASFGLTLGERRAARGESPDGGPPRLVRQWGKRGAEAGEFNVPIAIAITPEEQVLVTDFRNARLQRFSTDGKLLAVHEVGPNPSGLA